jgi:hypothetical protein
VDDEKGSNLKASFRIVWKPLASAMDVGFPHLESTAWIVTADNLQYVCI